ncbi:MAG: CDP-alcohol phosphatidyltransferase family protein [Candidatus Pacearchaeota archaeon]|jgi:phosphatidylglycerophosphate synthase
MAKKQSKAIKSETNKGKNSWSKELFLRKIAMLFFDKIKDTKIKAEYLTSIRIFLSILLPALLIFSSRWQTLIIIILLQFVLWIDYIDGAIARYKNNYKSKWVYIDAVSHYIISALTLFFLGLAVYYRYGNVFDIAIGSLSAIFLLSSRISKFNPDREMNVNPLVKGKKVIIYDLISLEQPFNLLFFFLIFDLFPLALYFYFLFNILSLVYNLKNNYSKIK